MGLVFPADFSLQNEGTIAVLYPLTPAAAEWLADNLPTDALTWAGGTVIEHRFIGEILCGIRAGGLEVRQ